jgi:glucan-binding YG repeat protein
LVAEKIESEQTQKTNLEEKTQHKHHHSSKKHSKAKKHHKKHQKAAHSLMQVDEVKTVEKKAEAPKPVPVPKAAPKPAPVAKNLMATKLTNQDEFDKYAQNVDVPIDEIKAITLKVSPTFTRDHV